MICTKELYQYNKVDFYLKNFMNKTSVPPFWIIAFIAGLPLFAETVYTPSLPDIARVFKVSESMAEYTLTIYIFGMAAGIFFWGHDCPNCEVAKNILHLEADQMNSIGIRWFHVNTYKNFDLGTRFGLFGIPTFFFFKGEKRLGRISPFPGSEAFFEALQKLKMHQTV